MNLMNKSIIVLCFYYYYNIFTLPLLSELAAVEDKQLSARSPDSGLAFPLLSFTWLCVWLPVIWSVAQWLKRVYLRITLVTNIKPLHNTDKLFYYTVVKHVLPFLGRTKNSVAGMFVPPGKLITGCWIAKVSPAL